MKISLKWLNEFIDVDDYFDKPSELAKILTAAGLEVDGIEDLSTPFQNVVIGHLLSVTTHPNADRLTLCQVSTGQGVVHQIVCGAKNHREGDRVVAALPGAILPGDFQIKRSKIRDVESNGMLCSETELGISSNSEGILILPEDAPIGASFAPYWGLDDIVFEINVTPNRADCLSHLGLARELSALTGREVHAPALNLNRHPGQISEFVRVDLRDINLCPRYAAGFVRNVKVGPSPKWLKDRLERVGMNSINNIVDITNFILLEMGQPLHAFDARQLRGQTIVIDRAVAGEAFHTLDGTELKLSGEELTIRDAERPVALAGVIGGQNSGISEATTDIVIESAYFKPETVRRTSRQFGVETDSSYRFSRGTNPEGVRAALDRACQLVQDLAHGEVVGEPIDLYPQPVVPPSISIELQAVSDFLGLPIEAQRFQQFMEKLGCEVLVRDEGQSFVVRPPAWRTDLHQAIDLVEECGRMLGYDQIPETLPHLKVEPRPHRPEYTFTQSMRAICLRQGYFEAVNYGFEGRAGQKKLWADLNKLSQFGLAVGDESIALMNPLNEELDVMRTTLVSGLLKNVAYNTRHGQNQGQLFEIGPVFGQTAAGERHEWPRVAFAAWGEPTDLWNKKSLVPPVFRIKASIERTLKSLQGRQWQWQKIAATDVPGFFHPGQTASLFFEGRKIGILGALHPFVQSELKIREPVAFAELDLEALRRGQPRDFRHQSISKFPGVERDLAFLAPKETSAFDIMAVIRKAAGPLMTDVTVFDEFEGVPLAAGLRSLAFRMTFQDPKATLADEQMNAIQEAIIGKVKAELGLSLR